MFWTMQTLGAIIGISMVTFMYGFGGKVTFLKNAIAVFSLVSIASAGFLIMKIVEAAK